MLPPHAAALIRAALDQYQALKAAVPSSVLFSKDTIRVYLVLALFVGLSRLFVRGLASRGALALLVLLVLASELIDIAYVLQLAPGSQDLWQWDSACDIFNGIALPVALWLYARWRDRRT
jgi:hypothetical protein